MRKLSELAKCGGCLAAAIALSSSAHADLVGLRVFREEPGGNGPAPSGPERWIYRVYAEFTKTTDGVLIWGIGPNVGTGPIMNVTADGVLGSGFTNIPDSTSGNFAPALPGTDRDWDTYMTIGVLYGFEAPGGIDATEPASPLNPVFIPNGVATWNDPGGGAGAAVLPGNPQSKADYRVAGNDTGYRVLLMQLTVNAGEHVQGTIGVLWFSTGGSELTANLTFNSVPSPGTALMLAGLLYCQVRRRR